MNDPGCIFLTAFEPSGDALAAALIRELRVRGETRAIFALGGPKMAEAGATLLESTTGKAVMGAGAVAEAFEHRKRIKRTAAWLREHRVDLHVPTDSPAANWSFCKLVRELHPSAKIMHMAAPQLWAWAPWRVNKLRRLTDHVLCLLPFEPNWFSNRGVAASFVGHPLYTKTIHSPSSNGLPVGKKKLALLPGSRPAEVAKNWPTMRKVYEQLQAESPDLCAVVVAADNARATQLQSLLPDNVTLVVGRAADALDWADAVLVVSGTATLQCARHHTPMVAFFNSTPLAWHGLGRWLIQTRTFTLPNLIAESLGLERAIPEFVPHFGEVKPLVDALRPLLASGEARDTQLSAFARFDEVFCGVNFATRSADVAESLLKSGAVGQ